MLSPGNSGGMEVGRRLRWAVIVLAGMFLLLLGRLWQLQVVRGDSYYQRTVSNVVREKFLPSVRGKIVDRHGVPLADNRPAFNIYMVPEKTPAAAASVIDAMHGLLGLNDDDLAKINERLDNARKRDAKTPVLVLEDQGRDRAALVEQSRSNIKGVEVRHEPYRFYPQGNLAAHLVGYMTQMTATELDRLTKQGYDADELVGRYGLEASAENYLRGKKGVERFGVDARGEVLDDKTTAGLISGDRVVAPVAGDNVVLTLDVELQRLAERAVAHVAAAAVVVLDIKTGKILAMVSKPSFDPNVMTGHLTRAEDALLRDDPRKPFIDKTLSATYPPGSVFKFVTTIAALEDGVAHEEENVVCTGEYVLANQRFTCNHGNAHGKLDLLGAIQHSCNVYFWTLIERVGLDRLAEVAREYGFGSPTNLGLNGDSPGRIPTKAWYEGRGHYNLGYATNAATGQGDVEVTVLQLAMAYAALGNGGTLFVPQIVERVESADGQVIMSYQPKIARQVHTPANILDVWKRGMWKVVNEKGGTGFPYAMSEIVPIAGKTGTAEVRKHHKMDADASGLAGWFPGESHAWFAGWAPADNPEIAIVVLDEHGGPGGKTAGPIAKAIIEGYWTKVRAVSAPSDALVPAGPTPIGATP